MNNMIWLFAGMLLVAPLLVHASGRDLPANRRIFRIALLVAAGFYVAFAAIDGSVFWLMVEVLGVGAFSVFYWLAGKRSINWL